MLNTTSSPAARGARRLESSGWFIGMLHVVGRRPKQDRLDVGASLARLCVCVCVHQVRFSRIRSRPRIAGGRGGQHAHPLHLFSSRSRPVSGLPIGGALDIAPHLAAMLVCRSESDLISPRRLKPSSSRAFRRLRSSGGHDGRMMCGPWQPYATRVSQEGACDEALGATPMLQYWLSTAPDHSWSKRRLSRA